MPLEYLIDQRLKEDVNQLGIDANQSLITVYGALHVLHENTTDHTECEYIRSVMFRVATQPVVL